MKLLPLSLLLPLIIFSTIADSKQSSKRIEMKCYVSMIGGEELIHYIVLNNEEAAINIEQYLLGKKILTTKSIKKRQVYKVKECISSSKKFADATPKYLDKNTAR
ncbi:MAG: hypothetical protein HRT38_01490 [Alteromonadaceae bacterium]|nr:hypothetical protein [Alteromonadaceae bacterium]